MRSARRWILAATAVAAAAGTVSAGETGFMAKFPDERRSEPHVMTPSQPMPHDFVDGQWEGIIAASDGHTYFSVSSHSPDRNAQFYRYDPETDDVEHLIDVGRWCGETEYLGQRNTQGKIHSQIYEVDGKLYCSTTVANVPRQKRGGHKYGGGHFLSYDLETGEFRELAHYEDTGGGGLMTMHYEPVYERLYAIHHRDRTLIYYDLNEEKVVTVGSIEDNPHHCRMLVSDDRGNVYGSTWGGKVYKYNPKCDQMSALLTEIPHDPSAPQPDPGDGKGWRKTQWTPILYDPKTEWYYAVRGNDEYLFRMRLPEKGSHRAEMEGLAPFGFQPSGKGQPRFASLGMTRKGRTIYYCSYPMWESMAHLMSYRIDTGEVTDHGPIVTNQGRRVSEIHSLTVGADGELHAVAMVWSLKGKDPTMPWAVRAQCYFHPRFMTIDPQTDFKRQ